MKLWTDAEKDSLRELIKQGISGDNIAKLLTVLFGREITRSAVGGAVSRLGAKLIYRPRVTPKVKREKPVPKEAPVVDANTNCTITELTRHRCRFPLWPDQYRAHPSFLYCGARTSEPPYCRAHGAVTYRNREPPSSLVTTKVPWNGKSTA